MSRAEDLDTFREDTPLEGDGFVVASPRGIADGEDVTCAEGVGVFGAEHVDTLRKDLFFEGDGFVVASCRVIASGEVAA